MKTKTITRLAIIAAAVVVAYGVDVMLSNTLFLGATIRFAVATIIVAFSISQLFDFKTAIYTLSVFGLISFAVAYMLPTLTSVYLMNPLISILPRVIVGFVIYGVSYGMKKVTKNSGSTFIKDTLPLAMAGGAGALTNTSLVLGSIAIAGGSDILQKVIGFILSVNFLIEFTCAIAVVPLIIKILEKNPAVRAMR